MDKKNQFRKERFSNFIGWLVSGLVNALYRVQVSGTENVPDKGPFIIIGNHQHIFDPLAIQKHVHPWVYWVAKKELYRIPVFGALLHAIGTIPFKRENLDVSALRRIVSIARAGEVVGIFPQGRRIDLDERDRVVPKAATAHLARRFDIPVLPVAIENDFKLLGKKRPHLIFGPVFSPASLDPDDKIAAIQMMRIVYGLMGQTYFQDEEGQQA